MLYSYVDGSCLKLPLKRFRMQCLSGDVARTTVALASFLAALVSATTSAASMAIAALTTRGFAIHLCRGMQVAQPMAASAMFLVMLASVTTNATNMETAALTTKPSVSPQLCRRTARPRHPLLRQPRHLGMELPLRRTSHPLPLPLQHHLL